MVGQTGTGVRISVEVWCDPASGEIVVTGAEPEVRQLILSVRKGSAHDRRLRALLEQHGRPYDRHPGD